MESLSQHKSVLVQEVLEALKIAPAPCHSQLASASGMGISSKDKVRTILDVTCGGAGHTRAILDADPTVKVIALDWDMKALERAEPLREIYGERLQLVWGSFAHLYKLQKKHKFPLVDGILADFGTSQDQIHEGEGFSFMHDTSLDMRMSTGHYKTNAYHVINFATAEELREIFWRYGEENRAKEIVARIIDARQKSRIHTTKELARIVEHAVGFRRDSRTHPATKVFQALRIFVNKELDNIEAFLPVAFNALAEGGRLVCISFHSLEDRLVKEFYKTKEQEGRGIIISQRPITPSEEELANNPSSRSSKLRVMEKKKAC
jgi:16S rRNA (cytosine1402-N4)-methyltransferase